MRTFLRFSAWIAVFALTFGLNAQNAGGGRASSGATWVTVPEAPAREYGVYHFRRTFDLAEKPPSFEVNVSADNRYKLYVNGEEIAVSPARGDLLNWRYDPVDIAKHLRAGTNTLAAVVWNFAEMAPLAQITHKTGFLAEGATQAERVADTGPHAPSAARRRAPRPAERIGGLCRAPFRWLTPERGGSVRRSIGATPPPSFLEQPKPFAIPAHSKAVILLDRTDLATAYPELVVSGGKSALVKYAETMRAIGKRDTGNRNDRIPHPRGDVAVDLVLRDGALHAEVSLPPSTEGDFVWRGQRRTLHPGKTRLVF